MELIWAVFGLPCDPVGQSWEPLGPSWAVLGPVWTVWGLSWAVWGPLGRLEGLFGPSWGCVRAVGRCFLSRPPRPLASSVLFPSASLLLPPS